MPLEESRVLANSFQNQRQMPLQDAGHHGCHGVTDLIQNHAKGLVIDLRDDPGGILQSASAMLGRFVKDKTVVTMRKRYGLQQTESTPDEKTFDYPKPVVILINENSASAAEIFSGVLRDYHVATLVGEHSYGKTSVQNVYNIPEDQASIKVTIAKYFLPSGVSFSREIDEDGNYLKGGLVPDVEVDLPVTQQVVLGDPTKDPQLKKAMDVVVQKEGGQPQAKP